MIHGLPHPGVQVSLVRVRPDHEDEQMGTIDVPMRTCAGCFLVAGALVAIVTPWPANILDRPVAGVVRGFDAWALLHVVTAVAVALSFAGGVGMVAAHRGRLGRLGQVGLGVLFVGVVLTASLSLTEAIVFPAAAREMPSLVAVHGPVLGSALFYAAGLLGLGWPLGLSLLGLAAARARVFGRAAGVLLVVSGPIFLLLAGPFVPVAGALACVVFGVSQVWWGALVWRSIGGPSPAADLP